MWHNGVLIQDNTFVDKATGGSMGKHPKTGKPLLEEARRTVQNIVRAVSDARLRSTFLTSVAGKAPGVVGDMI